MDAADLWLPARRESAFAEDELAASEATLDRGPTERGMWRAAGAVRNEESCEVDVSE